MKTIRVVAAVIKAVNEQGEPIIYATQRGYGEFKDGWEFPGRTPGSELRRVVVINKSGRNDGTYPSQPLWTRKGIFCSRQPQNNTGLFKKNVSGR